MRPDSGLRITGTLSPHSRGSDSPQESVLGVWAGAAEAFRGGAWDQGGGELGVRVSLPAPLQRACRCLAAESCPTLCDPVDCSPQAPLALASCTQARILQWVAVSFSRDLPDPGIEPASLALQADS